MNRFDSGSIADSFQMKDKSLSVPCPTCGSRVGERCVLNTDQPRTTSHYDRRAIAKDYAQSAKAARKMADDAKDSYARDSRDLNAKSVGRCSPECEARQEAATRSRILHISPKIRRRGSLEVRRVIR